MAILEKKIDVFKKILQCSQLELKEHVKNVLVSTGYKPVTGDGFLYAEGKIPILLVAHLDTVHKEKPTDIFYDSEQDVMWSPQGIGGDDRCGVYAILRMLYNHHPYVLFTEDEEKGCLGAEKAVSILKRPEVKFIIEIDRRGSDDCVFYNCGNKEFQTYIESFGFETANGTYSDICVLSDEWDIASVNLSSGYYNEHSTEEYIRLNELETTYERIIDILKDEKNAKEYKYERESRFAITNNTTNTLPRVPYHQGNAFNTNGYTDDNGNFWFWDECE